MTRKTGRSICLDEMVVMTYKCTTAPLSRHSEISGNPPQAMNAQKQELKSVLCMTNILVKLRYDMSSFK
jgi:hypothetical protein